VILVHWKHRVLHHLEDYSVHHHHRQHSNEQRHPLDRSPWIIAELEAVAWPVEPTRRVLVAMVAFGACLQSFDHQAD